MVTGNMNAKPSLIPMGHFGSVDDVASVAIMLATNDYMTGQTVSVNGGWYMTYDSNDSTLPTSPLGLILRLPIRNRLPLHV
jgi:hypothetical protein